MKKEDFKHGMRVTGKLEGRDLNDAKICINEDGTVFVCQDVLDGSPFAEYKFRFKYAWGLYNNNGNICYTRGSTNLKPVETPEKVDHPKHYNLYPVEAIDLMVGMFGKERVKDFCLLNAMKYRLRLGLKDDFQQDLAKERWYLDKYNSL